MDPVLFHFGVFGVWEAPIQPFSSVLNLLPIAFRDRAKASRFLRERAGIFRNQIVF